MRRSPQDTHEEIWATINTHVDVKLGWHRSRDHEVVAVRLGHVHDLTLHPLIWADVEKLYQGLGELLRDREFTDRRNDDLSWPNGEGE